MKIHKSFSDTIHLIIVSALTLFGFFSALSQQQDFMDTLIQYLPLLIVSIIIILAMLKGKGLVAYLLLLLTFYSSGISNFVSWFFGIFDNGFSFEFSLLIEVVVALFLLWMVVSYMFDAPKAQKKTMGIELFALLVYVLFQLVFYSATNALYTALIPLIIYLYASDFLGVSYLLSRLITAPLILIDNLLNDVPITPLLTIRTLLVLVVLAVTVYAFVVSLGKKGYNN